MLITVALSALPGSLVLEAHVRERRLVLHVLGITGDARARHRGGRGAAGRTASWRLSAPVPTRRNCDEGDIYGQYAHIDQEELR